MWIMLLIIWILIISYLFISCFYSFNFQDNTQDIHEVKGSESGSLHIGGASKRIDFEFVGKENGDTCASKNDFHEHDASFAC